MSERLLHTLPWGELAERARPCLEAAYGCWQQAGGTGLSPEAWYTLLISSTAAEVSSLDELVALSRFAFGAQVESLLPQARQALADPWAPDVLRRFAEMLRAEAPGTPEQAAEQLRVLRHLYREGHGVRGQRVMTAIRAALTGTLVGPCLGIVVSLLGRDRCLQRLTDALP